MTRNMRFWVSRPSLSRVRVYASVAAIGCMASCAVAPPTATSPAAATAPPSVQAAQGSTGTPPGAAPAGGEPSVRAPRAPEIVLDPKQPLHPLPELKVENIGLHIGGGPNDAETKAPFLEAVAERFPSFMDCYRKNEDPAQGGRFGVDLHIARAGGHPRIEQPRTSLRGPEFRACLTTVFESVDFKKPKHGPTTLSYSLRFTLVEAP